MIGNKEILQVAKSFHNVADSAIERYIEYGEILPAYIANASFAAELYLKSLHATSVNKVIFEIGTAKITRNIVSFSIHGHLLSEIYEKLPSTAKAEIEIAYKNSQWNTSLLTLKEELKSWSRAVKSREKSMFEVARYSYETCALSVDDAENLNYLLRFFRETIF